MASIVYPSCEDFPEDGSQTKSKPESPNKKRKLGEKSCRASKVSIKWRTEEKNDLIDEFEKRPFLWDVFNSD